MDSKLKQQTEKTASEHESKSSTAGLNSREADKVVILWAKFIGGLYSIILCQFSVKKKKSNFLDWMMSFSTKVLLVTEQAFTSTILRGTEG